MKKFVETILRIQEALGTILLAIFFIAIVLQIGARYLKISLLWTEELANYTFIWAVFMGASSMLYHRAHFSFTFFKEKFKGRKKYAYEIAISALLLTFTVPMFCYGIYITREFWNYNWISLPQVKMGFTWLCLPIMGFTMSLYNIYNIIQDCHSYAAYKEGGEAK